jgi:hypothetical protein
MASALDLLCGSWIGTGHGTYPDLSFAYLEEITFTSAPEWGMVLVSQRTFRDEGGEKGKALHLESGIVQSRDDGTLLFSCAQDVGRVEVMRGTVQVADDHVRIDWTTIAHAHDDRLVRLGRVWWVSEGAFRYEAFLSTVRTPECRKHLDAKLTRARVR